MKCMERPSGEQVPGVDVSNLAADSTLAICYSIDSEATNFDTASATFEAPTFPQILLLQLLFTASLYASLLLCRTIAGP